MFLSLVNIKNQNLFFASKQHWYTDRTAFLNFIDSRNNIFVCFLMFSFDIIDNFQLTNFNYYTNALNYNFYYLQHFLTLMILSRENSHK